MNIDPRPPLHPLATDISTDESLRGDPIDGERYYSPEFMQRGYQEPYLAGQESHRRVWHDTLNDYLEGRR